MRRLTAAKRASAAALTDPDVQQYMSAAVEQAVALQGGEPSEESAPGSEGDTRAAELAVSLIEDTEMGRRLHQTSAEPQPAEAAQQSEGER